MGRSLSGTGKLWLIAFLLGVLPLLGFSSAPAGGDHAAGTGETRGMRFDVGAESDAGGAAANGSLKTQTTDGGRPVTIAGKVTCLSVSKGVATIGARIERSSDPYFVVGTGMLITVSDGGHPIAGQSPDEASDVVPLSQPPAEGQCADSVVPLYPIEHGNVEVKDF